MVAYSKVERMPEPPKRQALSHELFHGLTPDEFDKEARALAGAEAMTPAVRSRVKTQLVERLKTPVDAPSWGPDWVRHGERNAPNHARPHRHGLFGSPDKKDEKPEEAPKHPLR